MRNTPDLLLARPDGPQPLSSDLVNRLTSWGARVRNPGDGLQMIRRDAALQTPRRLDRELLRQEQEEAEKRLNRFVRAPKFITHRDDAATSSAHSVPAV